MRVPVSSFHVPVITGDCFDSFPFIPPVHDIKDMAINANTVFVFIIL
jgi:hypothetical protein